MGFSRQCKFRWVLSSDVQVEEIERLPLLFLIETFRSLWTKPSYIRSSHNMSRPTNLFVFLPRLISMFAHRWRSETYFQSTSSCQLGIEPWPTAGQASSSSNKPWPLRKNVLELGTTFPVRVSVCVCVCVREQLKFRHSAEHNLDLWKSQSALGT